MRKEVVAAWGTNTYSFPFFPFYSNFCFSFPAYVVWGLLISLIPPFYPAEAAAKGATPSQVYIKSILHFFRSREIAGLFRRIAIEGKFIVGRVFLIRRQNSCSEIEYSISQCPISAAIDDAGHIRPARNHSCTIRKPFLHYQQNLHV